MPALLDQWWGVTLRSAAFNVLLMNSILASPPLQQTLTAALHLQCTRTEVEERQVVEVEKMPVVVMNMLEREDRKVKTSSCCHALTACCLPATHGLHAASPWFRERFLPPDDQQTGGGGRGARTGGKSLA